MRPKVVFLLVLVFGAVPTHAEWTWLYPQPQGHTLYDVEFLEDDTAIAVGDAGTVLVTHDTGLTWSVSAKTNGFAGALRKVARLDQWTAIAVGDGGVMLKTTDAGATWGPLGSGTTADLEDVDFVGELGIAVGGGQMIRSTNGGETWTPISSGYMFHGVHVVTSFVVVAVGDSSFARSQDGGSTWSHTSFPANGGRVSFSDSFHGAALTTNSHYIYTTSNGGQSWTARMLDTGYPETEAEATDLEMVDPQTILASGSTASYDNYNHSSRYGLLFWFSNGGVSWHIEWASRVLRGIAVNGQGQTLLVGDGGLVYRWAGRDTWERTGGNPSDDVLPNRGRVAFRSESAGMAMGGTWRGVITHIPRPLYRLVAYSVIARTSNAGADWDLSATRSATTNGTIDDVTYAPGTTIAYGAAQTTLSGGDDLGEWVIYSRVVKSTDDGATWTDIWSSYTTQPLLSIDFSSPARGVAVGWRGAFAVIDNDVVTPGFIDGGGDLQGVAFADELVAVAVGSSGLFRSEDGGNSWNFVAAPTGAGNAIDFASPSIGVALGNAGLMIRTDDGGLTWNTVSVPTIQDLHAVSFATATYGLAVGNGGTVLETTDAGLTWSAVESPTAMALTDVVCLSPGHAYVVGPDLNVFGYGPVPPSTLIASFDLTAEPFAALLRWSVSEDARLSHFVIRRRDGDVAVERTIAAGLPAAARSFRDQGLVPGRTYEYRLLAVDHDGPTTTSAHFSVTIPDAVVQLLPNHPNPFNPSTTIPFIIPERTRVRLSVYDVAGRHVVTLVDDIRDAGVHSVQWDGLDSKGGPVASGVYVSRLYASGRQATRKMVLLQ